MIHLRKMQVNACILTAIVLQDAKKLRCSRPIRNESDCIVEFNNNSKSICQSYHIKQIFSSKDEDVDEFGWTWMWAIVIVLMATPFMFKLLNFAKNILLNRHRQDDNAENGIEFIKADIEQEHQELRKVIFCCIRNCIFDYMSGMFVESECVTKSLSFESTFLL